jgi:predicted transcriptional regulator
MRNISQLAELTVDIVSAHLANNTVSIDEIPVIIMKVHESLSKANSSATQLPHAKTPIVPIGTSVKRDYIICLRCGCKRKLLSHHIKSAHGISIEQYRNDYGLAESYKMISLEYRERRRMIAVAAGLGRAT